MKPGFEGGAVKVLYPFEPAITTSKESLYYPAFLAVAAETGTPQNTHLIFVKLGGLGQDVALGSSVGSRSKWRLNAVHPVWLVQREAHLLVSYEFKVVYPMYELVEVEACRSVKFNA